MRKFKEEFVNAYSLQEYKNLTFIDKLKLLNKSKKTFIQSEYIK